AVPRGRRRSSDHLARKAGGPLQRVASGGRKTLQVLWRVDIDAVAAVVCIEPVPALGLREAPLAARECRTAGEPFLAQRGVEDDRVPRQSLAIFARYARHHHRSITALLERADQ